tara:strand:- start:1238 stop:1519 length:282 start_codon:yes stop_codon:yes gene_type:complete
MNIQDEIQKIHHKFGVSEIANYKIEQFIENLIKEDRAKQLILSGVSKSFTYKDISKVAEELANQYSGDKKDPVWRDIRQDGIKAIKAFVSKHL